jgi:adenosylcobyric acid synthase
VVRFPSISNFTDLDPLTIEAGVRVRYVRDVAGLGRPDLVVLPGSKATVADLDWLRRTGLAEAVARVDATVLGICGGYQMMGTVIDDPVECDAGVVAALGWLPVTTRFAATKITLLRRGSADAAPVSGYQIHHGRVQVDGGEPFVTLDDEHSTVVDGVRVGSRHGTTLHGLFEADEFRRAFLATVAERSGKRFLSAGTSFRQTRLDAIDALADALDEHLDMSAIGELIASATTGSRT